MTKEEMLKLLIGLEIKKRNTEDERNRKKTLTLVFQVLRPLELI